MGTITSQITTLTIVYSTVYSSADQRKHQSSASLAFVRGIHRRLVNSPHKWPVTRKMFPFDDVIMSLQFFSSYITAIYIIVEICACALSVVIQILIIKMYYYQGIRPVPAWLVAITKCHKDNAINPITAEDDFEFKQDAQDQENASNPSHDGNDVDRSKELSNHQGTRESRRDASSNMKKEFNQDDWQHIARVCDNFCFALFLIFHSVFIVAVIFTLLKED